MSLSPLNNSAATSSSLASINVSTRHLQQLYSKNRSGELQADPSSITKKTEHIGKTDVEKAVKTLNEFTGMVAQDILFSMDEGSGKTIVKVVDSQTKEVLRQLPSEEALDIAKSLEKMQGLLIHEKA